MAGDSATAIVAEGRCEGCPRRAGGVITAAGLGRAEGGRSDPRSLNARSQSATDAARRTAVRRPTVTGRRGTVGGGISPPTPLPRSSTLRVSSAAAGLRPCHRLSGAATAAAAAAAVTEERPRGVGRHAAGWAPRQLAAGADAPLPRPATTLPALKLGGGRNDSFLKAKFSCSIWAHSTIILQKNGIFDRWAASPEWA